MQAAAISDNFEGTLSPIQTVPSYSIDVLIQTVAQSLFQAASVCTDPICKAHEYFRQWSVVNHLSKTDQKTSVLYKKIFLGVGFTLYSSLALFTTLPGIALRASAIYLLKKPFLHLQTQAPFKHLDKDAGFSLLSWNICCVGGGYSISDGGVYPWISRIDRIAQEILSKNPDVVCLHETFDTSSSLHLYEKLKNAGYHDFYFNIGPRTLGVSSGHFIASKYKIENAEFHLFPQDILSGRAKHASKGLFSFDLLSDQNQFATICVTHLQHSETPQFPEKTEVESRKQQMQFILSKIEKLAHKKIVFTGDLNLDEREYKKSSWRYQFDRGTIQTGKSWGGDTFCTKIIEGNKKSSKALTLDYTFVPKKGPFAISTSFVETGFDPHIYSEKALSDHKGLLSHISLKQAS